MGNHDSRDVEVERFEAIEELDSLIKMIGEDVRIYSELTGKWRKEKLSKQILANYFRNDECYRKIEIKQ